MNDPGFAKDESLDPELVEQIDDVCDRFQAVWQSGEEPDIGDFLGDSSEPLRSSLLKELLRLELHYRDPAAETLDVERYHKLFPEHVELIDSLFAKADVGDAKASISDTIDWSIASTQDPDKPQAPTETAAPAKRFGRFELQEMLGRGGFGSVHRARDPQLHRDVALKFPRCAALMDDHDVQRFMREARAAAQLRHPNLVPVYEAGEIDGTYYIASAFVSGKTLRDTIKEKEQFSDREAATLIAKLAEALHFAHEKGIIHRDMKPENVMIDDNGEPHIMDFGLARRDEGEELLTREGSQMGPPAYMSPEQAKGKSHTADARTDLWALGVMLYELLAGCRPFTARGHEIITQIIQDDPHPPRKLDRSIPRDLETIYLKCLSKQPDQRYPSCQALHEELHRWLEHKPIQARPITRIERAWRWCRRNPVVSGLVASVGLGVIVGLKPALLVPLTAALLATWFVATWIYRRVKTARQPDRIRQVRVVMKEPNAAPHHLLILERLRTFVNREGSYFRKIGAASVTCTLEPGKDTDAIWHFTIEGDGKEEPRSFEPIRIRVTKQDATSDEAPASKCCRKVEHRLRARHVKQNVVDLGKRNFLIAFAVTAGAFTGAGAKQWLSRLRQDGLEEGPKYVTAKENKLWTEFETLSVVPEEADKLDEDQKRKHEARALQFLKRLHDWVEANEEHFTREDTEALRLFLAAAGKNLEPRVNVSLPQDYFYAEPSTIEWSRDENAAGGDEWELHMDRMKIFFNPRDFNEALRFVQESGDQSLFQSLIVFPIIGQARRYRHIIESEHIFKHLFSEEVNKPYSELHREFGGLVKADLFKVHNFVARNLHNISQLSSFFIVPDLIYTQNLRQRLKGANPKNSESIIYSPPSRGRLSSRWTRTVSIR